MAKLVGCAGVHQALHVETLLPHDQIDEHTHCQADVKGARAREN